MMLVPNRIHFTVCTLIVPGLDRFCYHFGGDNYIKILDQLQVTDNSLDYFTCFSWSIFYETTSLHSILQIIW